jgi:transposase
MAKTLIPNPAILHLDRAIPDGDTILLVASSKRTVVACPDCGKAAQRIHSRYPRTVADLPWQGIAIRFRLGVRKFFCDNKECNRRIFAEPLPEVVHRYARKTVRLSDALTELAFLVGGEAAARIARTFGLIISPDALLTAVKRAPIPTSSTPRVLGIDDFAFRRGHTYGTLLIDLERRCPVDMLSDRDAGSVTNWLKNHPGVQIISRDRGRCYKEGATLGAPDAVQVADRFHLLKNMGDTVEAILKRHHRQIREAAREVAKTAETVGQPGQDKESRLPTRTRLGKEQTFQRRNARFEQVHKLHTKGYNQRAISEETGIDRKTIRKYLRLTACPVTARRPPRVTLLGPFHSYIKQRWEEGCHNAAVILREITEQGYKGKGTELRDFVKPFRTNGVPQSRSPGGGIGEGIPAPSVVRWWLLGHSTTKDARKESWQRDFIETLGRLCPEIAVVQELAVTFGTMVKERRAEELDGWLERAKNCGVSEIGGFAKGLVQDEAAVRAALSHAWSNGPVEGQVNRLKFLKRSMYGRAGFDLLRARVLHRFAA